MTDKETKKSSLTFQTNWKTSIFVALMLPCLTCLGFWQLDRADEKRAIQVEFNRHQLLPATPINSLIDKKSANLNARKVSMTGHYLNSKNILIDNKIHRSKFGYEVVTPFQLTPSGHLVLINRGWIEGNADRSKLPVIEAIKNEQNIKGVIFRPSKEPFSLGIAEVGNTWPKRVPFISSEDLKNHFNQPLFPHEIRLGKNQAGGLQRNWKTITVKPEKHTGYAFQWFAMALTLAIFYLAYSTQLINVFKFKASQHK